jgi:hypothetical protein
VHVLSVHPLERLNGWSRAVQVIKSYIPSISALTACSPTSTHPVHVELRATWGSLPPAVRTAIVDVDGEDGAVVGEEGRVQATVVGPEAGATQNEKQARLSQRALAKAFKQHGRVALDASFGSDILQKKILRLSSDQGANEWLNVLPTYPESQLSDDEARTATLLWLGADIPILTGRAADTTGRSALRSGPAAWNPRHDAFRDVLAAVEVEAGSKVWTEVVGLFGPHVSADPSSDHGAGRRLDVFSVHSGGRQRGTDVTGVDAAAPDFIRSPACLSISLHKPLADKEVKKDVKYADSPSGFTFDGVAFGTQTELGPNARRLITELATAIARRHAGNMEPKPAAVSRQARLIHGRLGIAIMRHQARHILGVVGDAVSAALAAGERFVHPHFRRAPVQERCKCSLAACVCHARRVAHARGHASSRGHASG